MIKKTVSLFLAILLLASITLSLTAALSFKKDNILADYDTYKSISLAYSMSGDKFLEEGSDLIGYSIYHSQNKALWMTLLPFIFGIFNSGMLFLIIKKISKDTLIPFYSSIFFVLSPVFIYAHSTYTPIFFPLSLILLGTFSLLQDNYILALLSFIICFLNNGASAFTIILVLLFLYDRYKSKKHTYPVFGMLILASYVLFANNNVLYAFEGLFSIISFLVSDFGAKAGSSIFMLIIAAIGIATTWKNKKAYVGAYFFLASLFILSLAFPESRIFSEAVLATFAGLGVSVMIARKWENDTMKNYVLLLIMCGLIFSAGSYMNRFSNFGPNQEEIDSLRWLNTNAEETKNILSHYEYGYVIKHFSGNDPYIDLDYVRYSKDKERLNLSEIVFRSRDLDDTKEFFTKNNIGYVWINTKMKLGQVWEKEDEGILLLLETSDSFKKVYDLSGIEIWRFDG